VTARDVWCKMCVATFGNMVVVADLRAYLITAPGSVSKLDANASAYFLAASYVGKNFYRAFPEV
jgi:hypothetical protein